MWEIELAEYLTNAADPVPLVVDLHIAHDRFGIHTDPNLHGHLHYRNDMDRSLNEAVTDKIRKYRTDYNNDPPNVISFKPTESSTSGRLHSEFVFFLFLQDHRETDQSNRGLFHYHHTVFSSILKSKYDIILPKEAVYV